MTPVIQSAHAEAAGSGTTIAVTLPNSVRAGSAIVGSTTLSDNTTLSNVKNGAGTAATIAINRDCTNLGQWLGIYGLGKSPSGSQTMTATYAGTATSNRGIQAYEVSGLATPLVLSGTAVGNDSGAGTASAFDSSISLVPAPGAFVIAYGEGNTNLPAAAGAFSAGFGETVNNCTVEYLEAGSPVALSPSFTMGAADTWAVVIAAFAAASDAPLPTPVRGRLLLGSGRRAPLGTAKAASLTQSGNLFTQPLAVASTFAPVLTTISLYLRTLAVASTFTPALALLKSFFRTLAVASTFTPALALLKSFFRTLAVASTFAVSLVTLSLRFVTLAVSSTFTPVLTFGRLFARTLAVASTFAVALVKLPVKVLAVASTFTPSLTTVVSRLRTLAVSSTFTPTLTKVASRFRTLAVSSTFVVALAAGRFFGRTLAVASTFTAALSRALVFARTLAVTGVFVPVIAQLRSLHRILAVTSGFVATLVAHLISGAAAQIAYWKHVWFGLVAIVHTRIAALGAYTQSTAGAIGLTHARTEAIPSFVQSWTGALTVPPYQNQSIAGYVAGNKLSVVRQVSAIPTGRTLVQCRMTIKSLITDADPGVMQKLITAITGAGEGTITDNGDGTHSLPVGTGSFFFDFPGSDTLTLGALKRYVYDIQLKFDNGDIATFELGQFQLLQPVTQTET